VTQGPLPLDLAQAGAFPAAKGATASHQVLLEAPTAAAHTQPWVQQAPAAVPMLPPAGLALAVAQGASGAHLPSSSSAWALATAAAATLAGGLVGLGQTVRVASTAAAAAVSLGAEWSTTAAAAQRWVHQAAPCASG
jgi:hypothetical protein